MFRTFSCGFLKRHIVEIHKVNDFPWPPKFFTQYDKKVKEEEEEEELTVDTVEKKKQLRAKVSFFFFVVTQKNYSSS